MGTLQKLPWKKCYQGENRTSVTANKSGILSGNSLVRYKKKSRGSSSINDIILKDWWELGVELYMLITEEDTNVPEGLSL